MSAEVQVPTNYQYLRPHQVSELEGERRSLDQAIQNPAVQQDKGSMRTRKRAIEKMLSEQQAPELSPSERDAYAREAGRLEEKFVPEMLSAEVMRKNPPGAVDRNLRFHRKHAARIARWKNIQRALHKGDAGPDVANIERLRPHRVATDPSMVGAQIQGQAFSFPSEQFKANYEQTFGGAVAAQETQAAAPVESRKGPNVVAMPCGKMKAANGKKMHMRHCAECQEIEPASAEEKPTAA